MSNEKEVAQRNVVTARQFAEKVLGGGDLTLFDTLVAENVRCNTGLKPDGWIEGKAMYRAIIEALNVAFPDMTVSVSEAFAAMDDPNRVVIRFQRRWDTQRRDVWGCRNGIVSAH